MISKRGSVYWTRITVTGERYQMSLETKNRQDALRLEHEKHEQAKQGLLPSKAPDLARLTFCDALRIYLDDRHKRVSAKTGAELAANTKRTELERTVPLLKHLGSFRVSKFTATLVQNYLDERNRVVSPGTVNRELDLIRGMLKKAKLWGRIADQVKTLKLRDPIGRALSLEEKNRIEETFTRRPEWRNARLAYVLAMNTTMRPVEIKALEWRDVDFQ